MKEPHQRHGLAALRTLSSLATLGSLLSAHAARAGGEPCISDVACAEDEACVDFACAPFECEDCGPPEVACQDDAQCPSYQQCVAGLCEDTPLSVCGDVIACPEGLDCLAGQCVTGPGDPECDRERPCPYPGVCVAGHCELGEPECQTDRDCHGGTCIAGRCGPRFYDPPALIPISLPDPPLEREPTDVPPVWLIPDEDDPFGDIPPGLPEECDADAQGKILCCSDLTGWSFEKDEVDEDGKSLYQPWETKGVVFGRGPVYGNNVHIDRIKPPGYTNAASYGPAGTVGGDYWAFSRDVDQQGKWWLGSSDLRMWPSDLPGERIPESANGWTRSPRFKIDTRYIRFYLGGMSYPSQRVQLEIYEPDPAKRAALQAKSEGIGVTEFPGAKASFPIPTTDSGYVVVRASAPKDHQEYMHRRVAWDVSEFQGRVARVAVLDDTWLASPLTLGHINVDEVLCTDELDDEVTWDRYPKGLRPSKVGQAEIEQPLWGTTDTHTHPFANLAFDDRLLWGDPRDTLADVYSCDGDLPEIKEGTRVLRPAISQVAPEQCSASPLLVATVTALPCGVLFGIPFVGMVLGPVCQEAVVDVLDVLHNQSLVQVESLHGSTSALSGGITITGAQEVLEEVHPFMNTFDDVMTEIDIDFDDVVSGMPEHIHGMVERLGWDMNDGGHSRHGIKAHQIYQKDMIRRAYQGGLRMIGIDVIDSRTITNTLAVGREYDEWRTIRDTVHATRDLVSCGDDPLFPSVGPLCDIAGIALSPADVRALVKRNKIAIVLGTETDELGIPRDADTLADFGHVGLDSVELQIQDLWDLGIRKVTAIHALNNPLGGAGIFNDTYATGNNDLANKMDPTAVEASTMTIPFFVAGNFTEDMFAIKHLETKPGPPEDWDEWYEDHGGWIALDLAIGNDFIGPGDITFQYGFPSVATPLGFAAMVDNFGPGAGWMAPAFRSLGTWSDLNEMHYLKDIDQLLAGGDMCKVDGAALPLAARHEHVPWMVKNEHVDMQGLGHANAVGLREEGEVALTELMKRGMIIDLDHFSQEARVDANELAKYVGSHAFSDLERLYPFFGVHTNSREHERHGPFPDFPYLRQERGYTAETDRTRNEFLQQKQDGGVFSPGANAGYMTDSAEHEKQVKNDCDYGSKSFAHRYLWMLGVMDGHGLTPSTDMSPFFTPAAPRFGQHQCHLRTSFAVDMFATITLAEDQYGNVLEDDHDCSVADFPFLAAWPSTLPFPQCKSHQFPHDWQPTPDIPSGEGDKCRLYGKDTPGCPTYEGLEHQYAEGAGVWYQDYAGRESAEQPAQVPGPKVTYIDARRPDEVRDDGAPRAKVLEQVAIGGARQMWPMIKMKTSAGWKLDPSKNTGWDVNIDGFQHIGLYPDFLQDVRNVGVSWERMTPMFNAVEEYVRMWERQCELADKWASVNAAIPGCQPATIADLK